jgi:hypothetical protein
MILIISKNIFALRKITDFSKNNITATLLDTPPRFSVTIKAILMTLLWGKRGEICLILNALLSYFYFTRSPSFTFQ